MGLFSFLNASDVETISVVVDFGSASTGIAFVKLSKQKAPELLYNKRFSLPIHEKPNSKRFLAGALLTLEAAIANASKEGLASLKKQGVYARVSQIHCILSSPWFISQTQTLNIKNKKQERISPHFIQSILKKEEERLLNNPTIKSYVSRDAVVIERKVIHTRINGYDVADAVGKNGHDILLTIFVSLAPKELVKKIEDLLYRSFHPRHLEFHSSIISFFSVVGDIFPERNYLLVDMSGEATDITLVSDGAIAGTLSIPFGKNHLVRAISSEFNVSENIAGTFLRLFTENRSEAGMAIIMDKIVGKFYSQWSKNFSEALGHFSPKSMPQRIFLSSDGEISLFIARHVKEIFKGYSFKITIIRTKHLSDFILNNSSDDGNFAAECIFLNKLYHLQNFK